MHTWVKWYLVGPYYIWSGRAKHFTNKLKPNQKSKLSFYTLYHSDVVIKRLQPLLSHKPFSKSKPLGFNFLYFPFENKHLLPPETLSLAQHPLQYWLILKSFQARKALWWTMVGVLGLHHPWARRQEEQEEMQEQVRSWKGSPPCQEGLGGIGKEVMACIRRCKPLVAGVPNAHAAFQ